VEFELRHIAILCEMIELDYEDCLCPKERELSEFNAVPIKEAPQSRAINRAAGEIDRHPEPSTS